MEKSEKFVTLNIRSSRIILTLLAIAAILVLASVTTQAVRFLILNPEVYTFDRFNLDAEANIPTYFSTIILFIAAALLAFIAFLKNEEKDPYRVYWFMLSLMFTAMSLDETASIHDKVVSPVKSVLGISGDGFLYYAWIVPAAALVILIVILFFKFWLHLEYRTRILFAIAAVGYVSGALGFEAIGGSYRNVHEEINLSYLLLTTVEESLEIFSIILFIYALLKYLGSYISQTCLRLNFR